MKLHEAVELHGSKRAAAKALGIPWTTFRRQYKDEVRLETLIEDARSVVITDEELEAQRQSFAFGNMSLENPEVSRELVKRASIEQQVLDAGFSMDDVASAWIKSKEHSVQVKKRPQAATLRSSGAVQHCSAFMPSQ